MNKNTIIRIARPTANLEELSEMYQQELGFNIFELFENQNWNN